MKLVVPVYRQLKGRVRCWLAICPEMLVMLRFSSKIQRDKNY